VSRVTELVCGTEDEEEDENSVDYNYLDNIEKQINENIWTQVNGRESPNLTEKSRENIVSTASEILEKIAGSFNHKNIITTSKTSPRRGWNYKGLAKNSIKPEKNSFYEYGLSPDALHHHINTGS